MRREGGLCLGSCACIQLRQLCALLCTDARPGSIRVFETHRVKRGPDPARSQIRINVYNRIDFKRVFMFDSSIEHSK